MMIIARPRTALLQHKGHFPSVAYSYSHTEKQCASGAMNGKYYGFFPPPMLLTPNFSLNSCAKVRHGVKLPNCFPYHPKERTSAKCSNKAGFLVAHQYYSSEAKLKRP